MKNPVKICLLLLLLILTLSASVFSSSETCDTYWPKESWRTSTPEAQGMDSESIYQMLEYMKERRNFHSVLIIRNGYLVTEAYFAPYHNDIQQNIASCTKSFTSALIGMAIQDGLIKDIHQKVVEFFPEYNFSNLVEQKKAITIENLLSMTAGLDWVEPSLADGRDLYCQKDVFPMVFSKDSIQYILDHPMNGEPGVRFYYSSGVSHLLSAIIQKVSGMNTLDYANQRLFKPLEIADFGWDKDSAGIPWGGMNLSLTPLEMAKFGYLYLRQGVWEGKQIVPAEWVKASTQDHIRFNVGPLTFPYGYQWWVAPYGFYAAGHGGQNILVIPESDMVVVFTSGGEEALSVAEKFIIPAVKSVQPLPPNKKIIPKMIKLLREIESPKPKPVPSLPEIAAKISGKPILCKTNGSHFQSLSLCFNPQKTCLLKIHWNDGSISDHPVGLDGIYRTSAINLTKGPGMVALKGSWVSKRKFVLNCQVLLEPGRVDYGFSFDENEPAIEVSGSVLGYFGTIDVLPPSWFFWSWPN